MHPLELGHSCRSPAHLDHRLLRIFSLRFEQAMTKCFSCLAVNDAEFKPGNLSGA